MHTKLIIILALSVLSGCGTGKKNGKSQTADQENVTIRMEKTGCRGFCPVFTVTINGSGLASYKGQKHVDKTGVYTKLFSGEELKKLLQAFDAADFWAFEDEYTSPTTDLPTTYLSYTKGEKSKTIKDYDDAPNALKALEKMVEDAANSDGWKKEK